MKREFLLELRIGDQPLTKEVIDAIMAENGRDIQKVKANYADYEDVKTQLAQLQQTALENTQSRELAQQWEQKYHQAVEDHRLELEELAFRKAVEDAIAKAKGRSSKAICALLDLDALKASENRESAIEEAVEALKKDSRYLFEGEAAPPYAWGTGTQRGAADTAPTTLAGALREKFERK